MYCIIYKIVDKFYNLRGKMLNDKDTHGCRLFKVCNGRKCLKNRCLYIDQFNLELHAKDQIYDR